MKVIYILSTGHSGSTLLDIMLGQFDNIFSTGELKHFIWQVYRELIDANDPQGQCTCNKKFMDCPIWSKIISNIVDKYDYDVYQLYKHFRIKHIEHLSYHKNSIILRTLRKLYKLTMPHWGRMNKLFKPYFQDINQHNKILYETIFKYTDQKYIVDSSKDIIRYNELKNVIDIFPIIIIRNFENISNSKHVDKNLRSMKKHWLNFYNNQVFPIISKMSKESYHIISYEKFIDNPKKSFSRLQAKLNIPIDIFSEQVNMDNHHLVAGNPMRYSNVIKVRKKDLNLEDYTLYLNNCGLKNLFTKQL